MHFIKHIIEPTMLFLAWQSLDEAHRTRYLVAKLYLTNTGVDLVYLTDTADFCNAQQRGFESYPAFPDIHKTYHNVLNTFLRRLPPRSRGDFTRYLEGLRLESQAHLSRFALLGYSGAKLLSDGFSIIHPFNHVNDECELLLEVAGFRHIDENDKAMLVIGTPVTFSMIEKHDITQEPAIVIRVDGKKLGYVNRGLIPTVREWLDDKRVSNAWIEKINGTPGRPAAYIYTQILAKNC